MTIDEFIREATLGGPGLRGYVYRASVYCIDRGESLVREIAPQIAPHLTGTSDVLFSSSDDVPQPVFFEDLSQDICDR